MRGRKRDSIIKLENKEVVISTYWAEKEFAKDHPRASESK